MLHKYKLIIYTFLLRADVSGLFSNRLTQFTTIGVWIIQAKRFEPSTNKHIHFTFYESSFILGISFVARLYWLLFEIGLIQFCDGNGLQLERIPFGCERHYPLSSSSPEWTRISWFGTDFFFAGCAAQFINQLNESIVFIRCARVRQFIEFDPLDRKFINKSIIVASTLKLTIWCAGALRASLILASCSRFCFHLVRLCVFDAWISG